MTRWLFEVMQGGIVVAEGSCPDQHSAMAEAAHYVMMYGQDGEVTAIVRKPGEKKALRHKSRILEQMKNAHDCHDLNGIDSAEEKTRTR